MLKGYLRSIICSVLVAFACLLLSAPALNAQDKPQFDLSRIPSKVMEGLKVRFPKAEIQKWSIEKEDAITVYDFEFTQDGEKFEADIREDGTIHNWEQAITFNSLPDGVKKVIEDKYPKFIPKEVMKITAVKSGKDELEGYEIVLETSDKKEIEVTVSPDGRILEDSSDN